MVFGTIVLKDKAKVIHLLSKNPTCNWASGDFDYCNDLVSHVIFNDHCWEPYQTEIMIELFQKLQNKKFIDIGAHVGYYSIIASHYGWKTKSYEQNEGIFKILSKNLLGNEFALVYNEFVNASTPLFENDTDKVGLIKIDVEGNEPEIVKGILPYLKRSQVDALIIEISPKFRPVEEWEEMILVLDSLGYTAYDIGLSPRRPLQYDTNHLEKLGKFSIETLKKIDQTNILFLLHAASTSA